VTALVFVAMWMCVGALAHAHDWGRLTFVLICVPIMLALRGTLDGEDE
jgi:hypothetical protein